MAREHLFIDSVGQYHKFDVFFCNKIWFYNRVGTECIFAFDKGKFASSEDDVISEIIDFNKYSYVGVIERIGDKP